MRKQNRRTGPGPGLLRLLLLLLCLWGGGRLLLGRSAERSLLRWGQRTIDALERREAAPEETIVAIPLEEPEDFAAEARNVSYYYYDHLPEEDQKLYRELYEGLMDMEESITLHTTDYEHIYDLENQLMADHPEIFWYAGEGKVTQFALWLKLEPRYTLSAGERSLREEKIGEAVEAFRARIGPGETEYEKLATAFHFITDTVVYELGAPDDQNICSSLINKKSVCAGYAKGMQYLLQQVGIQCLYVYGSVEGEGDHAWNIVNLDGVYVQSDVTFGDHSYTEEETGIPDSLMVEYGYMCMDDATALRDRTISGPVTEGLPVCESTEFSYYRRHGWYYPEYSEQIWTDIRADLTNGARTWRVQLGTREGYERLLDEVYDNRYSKLALQELGLSRVRTYMLPNDRLYVVSGWIP